MGKSTVLRALAEHLAHDSNVRVLPEPAEAWREAGLLSAMYEGNVSPLEFQMVAFVSGTAPLIGALHTPGVRVIVTEGSPTSNREVYAAVNLSARDGAFYRYASDTLCREMPARRECTILLDVDVDTALRRIADRGRTEEAGISHAYLAALHKARETMFAGLSHSKHRVDATRAPHEVAADVARIIASVSREGLHRGGEGREWEALGARAEEASTTDAPSPGRGHMGRRRASGDVSDDDGLDKSTMGGEAASSAAGDGNEDDEVVEVGAGSIDDGSQPTTATREAPRNVQELLQAIATKDFGLCSDRSSTVATPAMVAYNKEVSAGEHLRQKRGTALPRQFVIVRVCAPARTAPADTHSSIVPTCALCGCARGRLAGSFGPSCPAVLGIALCRRAHPHDACIDWTRSQLCVLLCT